MKCYYEILEISREADDSEIKSAYRKLALKWHPDKNINNPEEAKEQFQLVQQAYEVLSDRQERAWYDKHREQILKGSNSDFKDDSLDVYQYFTTQCFKGYGDDENGFYTIYRNVFEKITKEDIEHIDSKSDYDEIPNFGTSTSDYNDVVGPFYAYWSSYTTRKSYVWLDPINIKEATNGRILKLIEKENKKVRQKAKKERNEEVRNLVAFVRKRDKRVQAHAKILEARNAENRLKQEELRKQKILQNKRERHNSKSQAEWSKFDNVKRELKEIEKNLAAEFGENLSDSDDDTSDEENEVNDLYCVACNKVFKTPKAFANHESSKKHKENIEILKQSMLDEENDTQSLENISLDSENSEHSDINDLYCVICDKEFKTAKALTNHEASKKHIENVENFKKTGDSINNVEDNSEHSEELNDFEISQTNSTKKKNKTKKVIRTHKLSTEDSELSSNDKTDLKLHNQSSDDDFSFESTKKPKKKTKKIDNQINGSEEKNTEDIESNQSKKRVKKLKKNVVNVIRSADLNDIDLTHCCVICKSNFSSKNKLFDHLKKTGHSVALPEKAGKSKKKAK